MYPGRAPTEGIFYKREFTGAWDGYAPEVDANYQAEICVAVGADHPDAVFMKAGCKEAFVHYTSAVPFALAMLEASLAAEAQINGVATRALIITDRTGREHIRKNVITIEAIGSHIIITTKNGEVTRIRAGRYTLAFRTHRPTEAIATLLARVNETLGAIGGIEQFFKPIAETPVEEPDAD